METPEVLKPGDTVYITRNDRKAEVISVDGDAVTVKPSWAFFQQTLSRHEVQSSDEWLESYRQREKHQHQAAIGRILGDGQVSTDGLARKLKGALTTVNMAERDHQTEAIRKLVDVAGSILTKLEALQRRIDDQDKEIEQLHKFARGERRL
jgi:hypothetical protein